MNGKTATLLKKWAVVNEAPSRAVKRLWKDTPRNKKFALRLKAMDQIAQVNEKLEIVKTPTGRTLLLSTQRIS